MFNWLRRNRLADASTLSRDEFWHIANVTDNVNVKMTASEFLAYVNLMTIAEIMAVDPSMYNQYGRDRLRETLVALNWKFTHDPNREPNLR